MESAFAWRRATGGARNYVCFKCVGRPCGDATFVMLQCHWELRGLGGKCGCVAPCHWGARYKSVLQECPKSVPQQCPTRVSHKSVPQECPLRVSLKSVPQEFPTTVSHNSVPQECPTYPLRVSYKSIPQEFPTRVSDKSVPQECPTRVSFGHM